MTTQPPRILRDDEYLGALAMRFRGTRELTVRQGIAREYAQTVERLVKSGAWTEMPALEDQLPDDCMPKEFFEFWSRGQAAP